MINEAATMLMKLLQTESKENALSFVKTIHQKYGKEFSEQVFAAARQLQEDQTVSDVEKVQGTEVTLKNPDGTKTIAPTTMLSKDEKGNLTLNKSALASTGSGDQSQEKPITTGAKVNVVSDSVQHQSGNYDAELTITNPRFNPNAPEPEEDDPSYYEEIEVGVNFTYGYSGKYQRATWGYHGGDPEEVPELHVEIDDVVNLDTGEDITKLVDLQDIEDRLVSQGFIESWRDYKSDDFAEPDDDYYEGINSLRKLSGLKWK